MLTVLLYRQGTIRLLTCKCWHLKTYIEARTSLFKQRRVCFRCSIFMMAARFTGQKGNHLLMNHHVDSEERDVFQRKVSIMSKLWPISSVDGALAFFRFVLLFDPLCQRVGCLWSPSRMGIFLRSVLHLHNHVSFNFKDNAFWTKTGQTDSTKVQVVCTVVVAMPICMYVRIYSRKQI